MTCTQYVAMPPEQSSVFAAWMSGWFNQKSGYTYINLEAYARPEGQSDASHSNRSVLKFWDKPLRYRSRSASAARVCLNNATSLVQR